MNDNCKLQLHKRCSNKLSTIFVHLRQFEQNFSKKRTPRAAEEKKFLPVYRTQLVSGTYLFVRWLQKCFPPKLAARRHNCFVGMEILKFVKAHEL